MTGEALRDQAMTAPGDLELVRAFVNTNDVEEGKDRIAAPGALGGWLAEHGLESPAELDERDVRRAIELREALRALLFANNDERLDRGAIETLNRAAEGAHLGVHFDREGGSELTPEAEGIDAALGSLLAIVFRSMAEGSWPRLKACRDDTCQWAFFDRSKNRSGTWCSMAVCGNRAKARAYRKRRRPGRSVPTSS